MLIGITGKAGAGKDTIADYLATKGFKRYAFADAVKDAADAVSEVIYIHSADTSLQSAREEFSWDELKRDPSVPEARRLLQLIGTELGRQVLGEDCWVDIVERKMIEDGNPANTVITDVRFDNEVQFVNDCSGQVWRIVRPDNPDAIQSTHASEAYDFECDYTIINDGTIADLHSNVARVLSLIALDNGG